jgi:endonuclease YncB( thermonuclease family)
MNGMRRVRPVSKRAGWRLAGDVALAAALLALLALAAARIQGEPERLGGTAVVHDGDTLSIMDRRLRLRGIDAPELSQTCRLDGEAYPCGRRARDALRALVDGQPVLCDGRERDRYGRLLAVCRAGDVDLNSRLVDAGWAVAFGAYESQEQQAREARRGLWAGEFESPRVWRDRHGGMVEIEHAGSGFVAAILDWLRFF